MAGNRARAARTATAIATAVTARTAIGRARETRATRAARAVRTTRAAKAVKTTRAAREDQGNSGQGNPNRQSSYQGGSSSQGNQGGGPNRDDDEFDSSGRRRRGRFRERNRGARSGPGRERFGNEAEPVVSDDDILVPVAGILDILDNYAFVRTSGYLPGSNDIYVSLAQVRRYGMRKGDAVTGVVRQPKDNERREKFNAMVRLDTVNGTDPEKAKARPGVRQAHPAVPAGAAAS